MENFEFTNSRASSVVAVDSQLNLPACYRVEMHGQKISGVARVLNAFHNLSIQKNSKIPWSKIVMFPTLDGQGVHRFFERQVNIQNILLLMIGFIPIRLLIFVNSRHGPIGFMVRFPGARDDRQPGERDGGWGRALQMNGHNERLRVRR